MFGMIEKIRINNTWVIVLGYMDNQFPTNASIHIDFRTFQATQKSYDQFILTNKLKTGYPCDPKFWHTYF